MFLFGLLSSYQPLVFNKSYERNKLIFLKKKDSNVWWKFGGAKQDSREFKKFICAAVRQCMNSVSLLFTSFI